GVTIVAMESTGVYWKPVWNLLEERFELMLVNAQHVKQVSGRKTDVKDCDWIGQLLEHGLLKASFVPLRPQRELRDLTRQRTQLLHDRARVVNRLQKVLEDANIKLASVATDITGKSGRAILDALVDGKFTPEQMTELVPDGAGRGVVGGHLPGQQRIGGQAQEWPDAQGQSVAQGCVDAGSLGRQPHATQLLQRPAPPTGGPPRRQAGDDRGGA